MSVLYLKAPKRKPKQLINLCPQLIFAPAATAPLAPHYFQRLETKGINLSPHIVEFHVVVGICKETQLKST